MTLFAFDVDGTLDCSGGPVPVKLLEDLDRMGTPVVIVSPSGAYQGNLIRRSEFDRLTNLGLARELFPEADVRLYISDNKDSPVAEAAGYCYIEAADFAKGIQR